MMSDKGDSKTHVLIVDDDGSLRFMLENKLQQNGYRVSSAANGFHGLQKVKSGEDFDIIVCDLKMPSMSGTELFDEIKMLGGTGIPFLIITGYPEKQKIMDAVRKGVSDVMLKPVKNNDLIEKIESMVHDKNQTPDGQPAS